MRRTIYDALGVSYSIELRKSFEQVIDDVYATVLKDYPFDPPPLLRVDGKLQLEPRTAYITTRAGTLTGISLKVFGKMSAQYARPLRSENVPYNTPKEEQLRILRAMCDIIAVQEQCDYRLTKAMRALPYHKEHLRPKKGNYG